MADASPPAPHEPARPVVDGRYIRRVIIAVSITLLAVALALLLWYGVRVLLIGFAGILLAVLLRAIADGIAKLTKLSPGWSLAVTVLLLAGLFVGVWLLLAPSVVEQGNQLADRLPQAMEGVRKKVASTGLGAQALKLFDRFFDGATGGGGGTGGAGSGSPTTQAAQKAAGALISALTVVLDLLIILFLGIYLAAQPKLYVDGLAALFPPGKRARICQVMTQLGHTLRWWLIAQAIDMLVIGVATWLGLWAIGVPLALTLGILAALFNFIPNFGPLFSYVPAVLLALVDSPEKAGYVTILYLVLQNVEGYLLLPLLQRGAVDTPPAVLIASQVLLTLLVGGLGLALAAPLTACALIVVKMLYVHDVLGDPVELATRDEGPRPGGPAI
jgi:predicted PurR-regulated permease PerM